MLRTTFLTVLAGLASVALALPVGTTEPTPSRVIPPTGRAVDSPNTVIPIGDSAAAPNSVINNKGVAILDEADEAAPNSVINNKGVAVVDEADEAAFPAYK